MESPKKKRLSGATLQFDVVPGKSLGSFHLGLPLPEAMNVVAKHRQAIPRAEFRYSQAKTLDKDLVIQLIDHHIQLRFDAVSQKLKLVEMSDFAKLELHYMGTTFSHRLSRVVPTFLQIYTTFGPTYPGEYDPTAKHYILNYPGISFVFPIPSQYTHMYTQKSENAPLPLEFPDGTTPVCQKIILYQGDNLGSISRMPTLSLEKHLSMKYYYEIVVAKPSIGIHFETRKLSLSFGNNCQDVLADFGSPNAIYLKKDHKMLIRSSGPDGSLDSQDYFFNYFEQGFDLLFDGETHQIKRIVLHTNIPGHLDFNSYHKCNFRLVVPGSATPVAKPPQQPTPALRQDGGESDTDKAGKGGRGKQGKKKGSNGTHAANGSTPTNGTNGTSRAHSPPPSHTAATEIHANGGLVDLVDIGGFGETAVITCDTPWNAIQGIMGQPTGDPVIASKGSSLNPYGATRYFGYSNLIFEVTESRHLVSLTLFPEESSH